MTSKVVIVDSGICNLFNIKRAFEFVDADVKITRSPRDILDAPRLILPGVGAFGAGMKSLETHGLSQAIVAFAQSGRPLLGSCLGMQLLLNVSEEFGLWKGLGLIKGKVRRLLSPEPQGSRESRVASRELETSNSKESSKLETSNTESFRIEYKIPQIGWNLIQHNDKHSNHSDPWRNTILDNLDENPHMYFVHSYVAELEDNRDGLAYTSYGRDLFPSVVKKDNIFGCQFHPERSGKIGLQILRNFLNEN